MKLLFTSAQPLGQAIWSRFPQNRAVFRVLIVASIISAVLFLLYIKQPASICGPGSRFCYSSPDADADADVDADTAPEDQDSLLQETNTPEAAAETPSPATEQETDWHQAVTTHLDLDPSDLTLDQDACYPHFFKILDDADRPWTYYSKSGIIDDEVNGIDLTEGRMKLSVIDKKILIRQVNLPTAKMQADAVATLQSLHDALASTDEVFDSIDFVMDVQTEVPDVTDPVWSFTHPSEDNRAWLIPRSNFLFGFDPDTASPIYKAALEQAVVAAKIMVDPDQAQQTRQFVPQPQLGSIGPTREQFMASVQQYERSIEFEDKDKRAVGGWPAEHPPASNPAKDWLDNWVFGEDWAQHTDPNDKSTGAEGYGKGVDMKTEPGKGVCQNKYIVWDDSFGPSYVDYIAVCGSVVLKPKSRWTTIYSTLTNGDGGFPTNIGKTYAPDKDPVIDRWRDGGHTSSMQSHNLVFVRADMRDVPFKIAALEKLPEYTGWIARNQLQTYRERYLTRAASACYWRTLVRAYADVYVSIKYKKTDGGLARTRNGTGGSGQ